MTSPDPHAVPPRGPVPHAVPPRGPVPGASPAPEPAPAAPEPASAAASAPPAVDVRSPLSDGEWHRMHPLSPLLKGGLFLLVVIGIVVTNLRDRLIALFVPAEGDSDWVEYEGDPFDFIIENDLILVAALVLLGLLVVMVAIFWVSWRFHTFRITDDDVEVRSGVIFRTHRRAPLDRVQGVNLTRPMVARLFGLAKLEVVGAGLDANVKLEYLTTTNAETIRGDILRLASGRQLGAAAARAERAGVSLARAADTVAAGFTGLIEGAEEPADEPESVVHLPTGRVIGAHLISGTTIWLLLLIGAVIVGAILGTPWVLFSIIPALIGFGTYWFRQITRSLRYSIAPTAAGVRITFGLFTTITETLPPGRIHAFEIAQPILWRRFGWWRIRVNRLSGRSATDTSAQQFSEVLPVGTRDDVERVLRLFLPTMPDEMWTQLSAYGLFGPAAGDPYTTTPRRARWLRPFSWKRNGFLLTPNALLLRHGVFRRALVMLPLARLQSVRISQGPIDRRVGVANITGHTVLGQVSGALGIIDRDDALQLWERTAAGVIVAAAGDRSHRWDAGEADAGEMPAVPVDSPVPGAAAMPGQSGDDPTAPVDSPAPVDPPVPGETPVPDRAADNPAAPDDDPATPGERSEHDGPDPGAQR
ncbi:PH domain-containing protein [Microbacterium sp. MC2]